MRLQLKVGESVEVSAVPEGDGGLIPSQLIAAIAASLGSEGFLLELQSALSDLKWSLHNQNFTDVGQDPYPNGDKHTQEKEKKGFGAIQVWDYQQLKDEWEEALVAGHNKRSPGRPLKGDEPTQKISVRLPESLVQWLDSLEGDRTSSLTQIVFNAKNS